MWISTLIEKWDIKDDLIFIIGLLTFFTWRILKEWSGGKPWLYSWPHFEAEVRIGRYHSWGMNSWHFFSSYLLPMHSKLQTYVNIKEEPSISILKAQHEGTRVRLLNIRILLCNMSSEKLILILWICNKK